jgi:tetratricopeptide (TPR) repeat protein
MERAARLYSAGDLAGARAACDAILRGSPEHFYALHLLSAIAAQNGEHEACVRLATRALQVRPSDPEVLSNRGAALRALCRYEEAIKDYDRALAIAPRSAAAWNNRGVSLAALGRYGEALESYEAALRLVPEYPRCRYNRASSHLALGDFGDGWRDYESRWEGGETPSAPRPFAVPRFTDADWGRGHRTALWVEQGLGDQILFSTLVPELAQRGERFVLEADRRLIGALRRAHPDWEVVAREGSAEAFAACDRHLPLGSLPLLLRGTRESFAGQPRALLAADVRRSAGYRATLAASGERPIGISWRTFQPKSRAYYERTKSAPLAAFLPLSADSGVRLVDLQYGDTAAERAAFAAQDGKLASVPGLDLFDDLDGLLAAIDACDAVVTTSNVTAHLAGAVGKRTLLLYLSGIPPFHYWVPLEGRRSRWYPSVEIVTAPERNTWEAVLDLARGLLAA